MYAFMRFSTWVPMNKLQQMVGIDKFFSSGGNLWASVVLSINMVSSHTRINVESNN